MRLNAFLSVIILLPLLAACGPTAKVPCPYQMEPMFGGQPRTGHCAEADAEFLASMDATGTSREENSQEMARLGFDYLNRGDQRTAMQWFNHAWLLNPDNCVAWGGFAIIKDRRDHDLAEAARLFEKGLELCPDNGFIMSDYGQLLMRTEQLEQAVSMFEKSLSIAPNTLETYKSLILAHIKMGNDAMTLKAIDRGLEHGLVVDQKLVEELKRRVGRAQ